MQNTLRNLHGDLLPGPVGRVYSELSASWLPVIVLFGVALWIARRRARRGATSTTATGTPAQAAGARSTPVARITRHGTLGICLALALLLMAATGLNWSQFAASRLQARPRSPRRSRSSAAGPCNRAPGRTSVPVRSSPWPALPTWSARSP